MSDQLDPRVARLLDEYRAALPDMDGSTAFLPGLWQRIDARQNYAIGFRRMAKMIITTAAAVSLLMGAWIVNQRHSVYYDNSYVELLAAGDTHESLDDTEIIHPLERQR
ncbi:MAG TPA: hypothetical protein VN428_10605 [Bryobacteraceae bacterium]|nr:hypothetical protein [Bryobacteraceae bacterium]